MSPSSQIHAHISQPSMAPQLIIPIDQNSSLSNDQQHFDLPLKIARRSFSSILTRFHAGYFRITLSLGSQALLFKNLILSPHTLIHHIFHYFHHTTLITLWYISLIVLALLSFIYLLRLILHPRLVKAEFLHHVGVNYLFAPWISWLLLLQCSPIVVPGTAPYLGLWWALVVPVVVLDIKIYGQWFTSKGQKHNLTAVANPTSQMTVIGNLIGSRAAALMGWKETAMILFSLGMVHYLVLFVTLYQRVSGSHSLPALLRPVFFLFFAAPGAASLAWGAISGRFDNSAKMLFFLSLFLFTSLVCRPLLFKRAMRKFNVTWWAYPFPVTLLAIAATEYAGEVKSKAADVLMLVLAFLSMLVTFVLVVFSLFNTRLLLPDNDPFLKYSTSTVFPVPNLDQLPITVVQKGIDSTPINDTE